MDQQETYQELLETIMRVVNKFQAVHKIPRRFGIEEELYPREIHTIQAIGNLPGINVTDLAVKLGVTKGTMSPIVTRLVRKKLVTKYFAQTNHKERLLRLTPKGEIAYHAHEIFDRQLAIRLFDAFEEANRENLRFLKRFLQVGEAVLDEHLEE